MPIVGAKKIYYAEETKKAVRNFQISGRAVSLHLIKSLALVKIAAADTNFELKRLSPVKHKAIVQACREIIAGELDDQFVTDVVQGGAGTSVNMNINEVVANRATEFSKTKIHYLDDVNMSQSTNDVIPTALRLVCLRLLDEYLRTLAKLEKSFSSKSGEFKDVIKVGRTHIQDAVPITLGQEFGAYSSLVKRDIKRLDEVKKCLLETNLGGTAIGTGINSSVMFTKNVNKRLSELSGYKFTPSNNLIDATQNVDVFLHMAYLLEISALGLAKIASDLRLLASGPRAGFGEIILPVYQKGSSIMPAKNNPVTLEVISQVAFEVMGNAHKVSLAFLSGQLELNVMLPIFINSLIESFEILVSGAATFSETVTKIKADRKHCKELLEQSLASAATLIRYIGYDKSAEVVKKATLNKSSLQSELLKGKILSKAKIKEIFSNGNLTKPQKL